MFSDPSAHGEEVIRLRPYEIVLIVDPRLTEEEVAQLLARLQEAFQGLGGEVGGVDNWGKRRLTYEIRKQREGTHVVLQVKGEPAGLKEFERQLKLNESVLRFLIVRVSERRRKARSETGPQPVAEEVG